MHTVFLLLHVVIAVAMIALVLLQQGKGADAGAAFGSGASSTMFGSQGSGSFLSRATGMLAAGFFATSLVLAYFSTQVSVPTSIVDQIQEAPVSISAPEQDSQSTVPQVPQQPTE